MRDEKELEMWGVMAHGLAHGMVHGLVHCLAQASSFARPTRRPLGRGRERGLRSARPSLPRPRVQVGLGLLKSRARRRHRHRPPAAGAAGLAGAAAPRSLRHAAHPTRPARPFECSQDGATEDGPRLVLVARRPLLRGTRALSYTRGFKQAIVRALECQPAHACVPALAAVSVLS
eukprot:5227182-Pleurochrysis_carterae.AAC.1